MNENDQAIYFLDQIKKEKPRYIRDQLQSIITETAKYTKNIIKNALTYYVDKQIWSAVEFRDISDYLEQLTHEKTNSGFLIQQLFLPNKNKTRSQRLDRWQV